MTRANHFSPRPWLAHPHVQTILGVAFRDRLRIDTQRLWLDSAHGDPLSLDWAEGRCDRPALLILHGIAGPSRAAQVVSLMKAVQGQLRWRVGALNFRGADERFLLPRLYHGGSSDDLRAVVAGLLELWQRPLVVVGLSLGANILLKWLGEEGAGLDPRVQAACAIGSPFDLGACGRQLESTVITRFYRRVMVKELKARVSGLARRFPGQFDLPGVLRSRTFAEFDAAFTAPVHGFRSLEHYYQECSSAGWLLPIARPTMIVSALDDPFLGPGAHPDPATVANSWLKWETPQNGGHLGFVNWSRGPVLWVEDQLLDFLSDQTP